MIKLSTYAKLLCEGLTVAQAVDIFTQFGISDADKLDKEKLKVKWLELVKKYHSDVSDEDPDALKHINAAYDVLKNQTSISQPLPPQQNGITPQEPWQPDKRASRNPNPSKPDVNYYKKRAWEISGKPASTPDNVYTFWNWDGYYLCGAFTVYTTPEHWYEVSKLLIEWDHSYRSKAVLVTYAKADKVTYMVNKNGQKVEPPQPIPMESGNANPGNDWGFIDRMRKIA